MNERELAIALRSLDGPARPDPAFAEALFETLRREAAPRRSPRLVLLLVAALLLATAAGIAIVGGAERTPNPLINETVPSPRASGYAVLLDIPEGADRISNPAEVEEVVTPWSGMLVTRMQWVPANEEFTLPDGRGMSSETPFWAVTLARDPFAPRPSSVDRAVVVYVEDGTLRVLGWDDPDASAGSDARTHADAGPPGTSCASSASPA